MDREREAVGERITRNFLIDKGIEYNSNVLDRLRVFHQRTSSSRLLLDIADGSIALSDDDVSFLRGRYKNSKLSWRTLIPFIGNKENNPAGIEESKQLLDAKEFIASIDKKKIFSINELNIERCTIADCCKPIPGDDALGYIDEQEGTFTIHKREGEEATRLTPQFGNNIVAVKWDMHHGHHFETQIRVEGVDKMGTLFQIAESLFKHRGLNVKGLNIQTDKGLFHAELTILVHDALEINDICQDLLKIESILKAVRI